MKMRTIGFLPCLLLFLIPLDYCYTVLSSGDMSAAIATNYAYSHTVGLSMSFPQLIPYWNNSVYRSRVNTSMFLGYNSAFYQSIHVPKGYKYNCNSTVYNGNVTCLMDLSKNTTLLNTMGKFIYDNTGIYACDVGYDMERSNFSRTAYTSNFGNYINFYGNYGYNMELIDQGDLFSSIYNRTYTAANWMSDVATITNNIFGIVFNGPGITESADSSWVNQLPIFTSTYGFAFTFRCLVFKNSSQATIDNLMSEYYGAAYLKRRLVDANNATLDVSSFYIGINQIRLTNDTGVNGVTNSFAAALWALDILVQFASMGGLFMNFYNPLTASNQSVFGAGPNFVPAPIYYALLFANYALMDNAYVYKVTLTAGFSSNIKAYGLQLSYDYRILIINKDTNPNASGIVSLKYNYSPGMRCYYLSAPALNSTTNVTYAGMQFVANSSEYVGSFWFKDYKPTPYGIYEFVLNYSQAVLCEQLKDATYSPLTRGRSSNLSESLPIVTAILLALLLLMQ